jgi:hypothetical protein
MSVMFREGFSDLQLFCSLLARSLRMFDLLVCHSCCGMRIVLLNGTLLLQGASRAALQQQQSNSKVQTHMACQHSQAQQG